MRVTELYGQTLFQFFLKEIEREIEVRAKNIHPPTIPITTLATTARLMSASATEAGMNAARAFNPAFINAFLIFLTSFLVKNS